jgi:DNA-binding transcriptional LysR family regulator
MSIRQFEALRAVGDHGSFAAAARALGLAPSALSMQIAALETTLGAALFDRARRPPRLTRAGETALERARALLAEYEALREAVGEGREAGAAFRVGVIPTALTDLLPPALVALRARRERLAVSVHSDMSGELMRMVAEGALDAALIHRPEAMPPGFVWREVVRQQVVVVAPADAPEPDARTLLTAHPYIRFNRAAWVAPLIERRLAEIGLAPRASAEIQSIEAIHLLVSLGFGVSVLPDVGSATLAGRAIRRAPFGEPPLFRSIGFLTRRESARRRSAEIVAEAFAEAARAAPASEAPS